MTFYSCQLDNLYIKVFKINAIIIKNDCSAILHLIEELHNFFPSLRIILESPKKKYPGSPGFSNMFSLTIISLPHCTKV